MATVDGVEIIDSKRPYPRAPHSYEWAMAKEVARKLGNQGRLTIYDQAATGSLYGYITLANGARSPVRIADHPKPRPSANTIVKQALAKAIPMSKPPSQLALKIARRLGIFAKANFNCGIGPEGFEPGNTCGAESGGSGGSDKLKAGGDKPKRAPRAGSKPPPITAQGIEERAKASGRSFTEQYLHESRSAIDREHKARERRREKRIERANAEVARIDTALEKVKKERAEAEAALNESRARRAAQLREAAERQDADLAKRAEEARKAREAAAAANAASKARIEVLKRQLAESKARSRGLRI